ncbi:MAG: hypothetical protein U5K72_01950 [Balneolaceae bacterium]|nr:hypothetical protein [Balneolaceae bacterium]
MTNKIRILMQMNKTSLFYGNKLHSKIIGYALLIVVFATLAISCSSNTTGEEPEDEGPGEIPESGLFLSVGGDTNGLHVVDTETAEAFRVGDGKTGAEEVSVGLAAVRAGEPLIGSNRFALHRIAPDGSSASVIGDPSGQAFTEGLAYDPEDKILYASSNGFLHIRNPNTGETIETVLSPPNQPDIEGLALDARNRILYGLARGSESQPQFRRELYALDVSQPSNQWVWESIGDTGGLWAGAGLAFNGSENMLYATGRMGDSSALYRIDPETGETTRLGDTGLASAAGGLAWVSAGSAKDFTF